MKKIFSFLALCSIGILGLTTDASARTACAAITCNCCTGNTACNFLALGGLPEGCSNGKQCNSTSNGSLEALSRDDAWLCTAAASGYRLTSGCAPQKCPTGCKTCCTSSSGKAVCTSCNSGYVSSGDDCVADTSTSSSSSGGSTSTKCDITAETYTTKAACLSACGSTICTSCLDRETMMNAWQCPTLGLPRTLECTISNCTTCNALGTKCTKCNAGYYLTNGTCTACPAGKISSAGATECTPCSAGTYASGTGNTLCVGCTAGYYSAAGASACTMCSSNTYSATGATSCTPCGSGKWSAAGSSSCSACPSHCTTCSNGTSCDQCETGYTWSSTTRTCVSASLCNEICSTGTYNGGFNNAPKMICEYCPSVANGYCTGCPSADCIKPFACAPGYVTCKPGYYKSGASCVACAPGNYQPDDNSSRTSCVVCSLGYYTSGSAATSCTSCNTLAPVSGGTCTKCTGSGKCTEATCPTGQALDTTSQSCVISGCAAGQYKENGSCQACPAGYYCSGDGTKTPCAPGTYSKSTGATSCTPCDRGSYQPESGKTSCLTCDPGTFAGGTGNTRCTYCSPGTIAQYPGSYQCTACGTGTYASGSAATECKPCSPGTYASKDKTKCESCPAGFYCNGTLDPIECVAPTYSTGGASTCTSCSNLPVDGGTCNSCTTTGSCTKVTCNTSSGYVESDGSCVLESAICKKFYGIYNGTCTKCIAENRCTEAKCDSSALYFSADDYGCICPNGFAYNASAKKCEEPDCPVFGTAYSASAKTCLSCSSMFSVANGTCGACTSSRCDEIQCNEGYMDVGGVCKALKDIFPMPNGHCVSAFDTDECSSAVCDSEDLVFAGKIDWQQGCVCKDSSLTYDSKTKMCILDSCPKGQYKDLSQNKCVDCISINIGEGTCTDCIEGGQCTEFVCKTNAVLNVNMCEACPANTIKLPEISNNRCCSTLPPPGWNTTWTCDTSMDTTMRFGYAIGTPEWNAYVNCKWGSIEGFYREDPTGSCTKRSCKDVPVTGGVCADCDSKSGICTAITCENGYRVAEKEDGWKSGESRYCIQDFASTAVKYCDAPLHYVAAHEACER